MEKYEIVKPDGSPVTPADAEIYAVLLVSTGLSGDMKIDTNIATPSTFRRKFYNFGIKAYTNGGSEGPQTAIQ